MSFTALTNEYQSHIRRKIMWILLALVILIILAAAAVCIGVADLTPARLAVTWLPLSERYLDVLPLTPKEENVLLLLRLPRVAAAVIAGAGLGLAGTGMQAITGNHMASPFTTGLSRRSGPGCRRSDYLQRNTCLFSKNRYGHGRFPDGSHLRRIRLRFIKPEGFGSRNARFNRYRTELLLQCT